MSAAGMFEHANYILADTIGLGFQLLNGVIVRHVYDSTNVLSLA